MNATKTLVQAFISCRLDYCNSLLYGISDGLLQRLQSVQNGAARLVTGARRDHITPVLRQLRWRVQVRRPLRSHSNDIRKLLVPRKHNKLGDRSFSAAGPRLWNDLLPGRRRPGLFLRFFQTISENTYLWRLKRLVTLSTYRRYINKCIYLSIFWRLVSHALATRRDAASLIGSLVATARTMV